MYTPKNLLMKILPCSLWLAYDLKQPEAVTKLLPPNMQLANVKLLHEDSYPKPKLLFNSYKVDSSFMKGNRCEILTFAKSKNGIHFVILDCLTNTMDWNPNDGIKSRNANLNIVYSPKNNIVKHRVYSENKKLFVKGIKGASKRVTNEFVVDANKLCYYKLNAQGYAMDFDKENVSEDVILLDELVVENQFWKDYRGALTHCFFHKQTMTYRVDV